MSAPIEQFKVNVGIYQPPEDYEVLSHNVCIGTIEGYTLEGNIVANCGDLYVKITHEKTVEKYLVPAVLVAEAVFEHLHPKVVARALKLKKVKK
jgi:hypothetical protein